mmetsp:Transcript_36393/g.56868  ORF Transcript_36393/g.56868 Transcript_36393/m.56868 type:complete len:273 (-) Transcript_36393:152-970(-)
MRQNSGFVASHRSRPQVVEVVRTQVQGSTARTVHVRSSGLTFIADTENHCIQVMSADGIHLRRVGTFGKDIGQFNALQGLVVHSAAGILYVVDTCNHRIQVFSYQKGDLSDVKCIKVIGKEGRDEGQFRYPMGIALDLDSNQIVVADTGNDRLQIFSCGGEFVRAFGHPGKHTATEEGAPCFRSPYDVAVFRDKLFVADEANHRIQVVDFYGSHVMSLGGPGTQTGSFLRPTHVLVGPSGTLLVSDQENARVQMLCPEGERLEPIFRWRRLR